MNKVLTPLFYIDSLEIVKGVTTPAIKKNDPKKKPMRLKGVAGTIDMDLDGQMVDPEGFNLDYFLSCGFVNWHHGFGQPKTIIGEPIKAEIRKKQFYVEVELYDFQPMAIEVYEFAEGLEKSGATRTLGWSIEGFPTEKEDELVSKAIVTGLAITPMPKNFNTYVNLLKGIVPLEEPIFDCLESGNILECGDFSIDQNFNLLKKGMNTESVRALTRESLEKNLTNLAYFEKKLNKGLVILSKAYEMGYINKKDVKKIRKAIKNGKLDFNIKL